MTSSQAADERPRQRRRLLSSSEAKELTAQRRTDLLAAAQSHSPYTWTNTDVHNALLWFRQPATSASATNAANAAGPGKSSLVHTTDKDAFGLLRSLLHNPGIAEARPARPPRQTADDDSLGDEYRIRKEPKRSEAPIREVLVGYASVESTSAAASSSAREPGVGRRRPLDAMRSDLADIAQARSETHELYNACLEASSGGNDTSTGCDDKDAAANESKSDESLSNLVGLSRDELCLAVLDESDRYFQTPSTAVATAYASEIYDRLVDLEGGADNTGDGGGGAEDSNVSSTLSVTNASKQLLDKLRMLALSNMRVVEVYGLVLLEPIRRLRLFGAKQGQTSSSAVHDSESGVAISSLDVDKACSSALCTELCQNFISLRANDQTKEMKPILCCSAWANLPSPLLSAISHAYFPFALEYIRNLFQRNIDIHLDMPRILADRVMKSTCNTSSSDANEKVGEPGGSMGGMSEDIVLRRILALFGTSDRLSSLVRNELERGVDFEGSADNELTGEGKRKDVFLSILEELQFD